MIGTILIVGLICGVVAFFNSSIILPRTWQSILVAIVTFVIAAIAIKYEIMVLLAILIIVMPIPTIILIFKDKRG